jgi:hypothetical protein
MRIAHPATVLVVALSCFLAPFVFSSDLSDPAGLEEPAGPEDSTEPQGPETPADPGDSTEPQGPTDPAGLGDSTEPQGPETPADPAGLGDSTEPQGPETPAGSEEPYPFPGEREAADEEGEALPPADIDLEMTVYYDERTGSDYVEIRTPERIEEYHYLSHIRYSDLIFVLSDLLRRITRDGYRWSSAPEISYEKNEEVALLYRKDLAEDMVYGIVQFPDFKVSLSGVREPDAEHRFNAENGRDMMTLVFSFASCLAQAEQTLGIKQLEYTMQFFKPE